MLVQCSRVYVENFLYGVNHFLCYGLRVDSINCDKLLEDKNWLTEDWIRSSNLLH